MAAEGQALTAGEYVIHHLQHLQNKKQTEVVDFSVINFDSVFFSAILGVLTCWLLWKGAKAAHAGVPGRFQAFIELLVELVDTQAKGIIHNAQSRKFVAPLALTVFIWVFFLNFMDLIPVDLIPHAWALSTQVTGLPDYMRVVPTADLSITMGLSVTVLLICIYYSIKIKGFSGWMHELFTAPFGNKWFLYPVNFAMQIVEYIAKTVSHGMRLFGNLYAGELIFILIALMGGAWVASTTGVLLFLGHIFAGTVWAIFHILIITLQAFVFMMLTLVYIGQAHDHH